MEVWGGLGCFNGPSFTCVRYTTVLFELSIGILLEFLVTLI